MRIAKKKTIADKAGERGTRRYRASFLWRPPCPQIGHGLGIRPRRRVQHRTHTRAQCFSERFDRFQIHSRPSPRLDLLVVLVFQSRTLGERLLAEPPAHAEPLRIQAEIL